LLLVEEVQDQLLLVAAAVLLVEMVVVVQVLLPDYMVVVLLQHLEVQQDRMEVQQEVNCGAVQEVHQMVDLEIQQKEEVAVVPVGMVVEVVDITFVALEKQEVVVVDLVTP
jgi:hypothetical protein